MKTVSLLDIERASSTSDIGRNMSSILNMNLPRSTKTQQKNLLENTLANRLRQHRHEFSTNKENLPHARNAKPPKRPHQSSTCDSKKTTPSRSRSLSCAERNGSATSSISIKSGKCETTPDIRRVDSKSSDIHRKSSIGKSPLYTSNSRSSHRSSSADHVVSQGSLHSGTSRLTSASSFFHSTISSGLVLESRGADFTIKVVKKDGVFKPIDKYASSRCLPRETGLSDRNNSNIACDYELFTLPDTYVDHSAIKPNSRDSYADGGRRPLKVSWSKAMDNADYEEIEVVESRMESIPPPITPNNMTRASSSSSFKRPVYSSGKSQVQSIGLRWRVPTASPDEEKGSTIKLGQPPKKPMWSWLITPETKQKERVRNVGQLSKESKNSSKSQLNRVNSTLDVRTNHSRDLHPVATATAKDGTSVSKTKWQVPSSNTSTLEAERIAMDRLELVKRDGKIYADNFTDIDDTYKNNRPDETINDDSEDGEIGARRKPLIGDATSYGTKSNVDSLLSPAKSRSTYG